MAKFDFDEAAPVKKPTPVGWIFAGLVTILGAGFAFAFYVPLTNAHNLLVEKHEELAKKTQELDQALKSSGADLKSSADQLSTLQKSVDEAKSQQESYEGEIESLSAAAKKGLDKLIAAKHVTFAREGTTVRATAKGALVFRPKSSAPLPFASKFACGGAAAVTGKASLAVQVEPSLDDKDGFTRAGEQAGALADMLRSTCKLEAAQVRVSLSSSGGKPGDVTLLFSAGEPPKLHGG